MSSMVPREYRTKVKMPIKNRLNNLTYHKYGLYCYICSTGLDDQNKSIDHVIPLSKGGKDSIENMRPCCLKCNQEKDSKILEDFLRERYLQQVKL